MSGHPILNLPNLLTISRIIATPVFLLLLFADVWYYRACSVLVFSAASLTDLYDGRLARSGGRVTEFGRFMDPLADKILVTSALVALAIARIVHAWLVIPIVIRDVIITSMRMYGLYRGRMMETSTLAKWKTVVQLVTVIVILLSISVQELSLYYQWQVIIDLDAAMYPLLANGLMAVVLLLTVLTGFHYLFRTDQHSSNAL
ncbi:MAG: CDP-diacylglycerol--glycerol-3-phosphate 3-phosphatidyltransferase [Gemmatimonadetes bacterium]|jgi:CDP-diacylglycerol--glycerol-3-phosphate 3-phosphatidyltransferase|nr:CDP-diacylglycerol--glycerol-3-phosphate 3-phosphatidyltransferase [Gemmatimonadota bacterium]MBT4611721.1 CDP-diacylglycerol--glycerol-3-phosphate 3-phosphatidyltransferase [Gemmatimonadota bacterium]MBT5056530.1 CDP-diacylglycerol--glycerol-3-phosphate 3-phosphatidyltransferase [Gemmatimonadota bacterium]MBT5145288.1 CDP-diacylglycerol--glycerol-3-phosphate 3-phosphatidyltransferase [Gemmatimonadota bacterium]MBT5588232.1 CDP-diacylglycerol--glycerol-3-phosphate 3-phosphatidyltransferase [